MIILLKRNLYEVAFGRGHTGLEETPASWPRLLLQGIPRPQDEVQRVQGVLELLAAAGRHQQTANG